MKTLTIRIGGAALLAMAAMALAGCGSSVDQALVDHAGVHGNALEKVYALYKQDVFKAASSRSLKDVNAALKAKDPKKASPGDLRRAQTEIAARIDKLAAYRIQLASATSKLRKTKAPDFSGGLDKSYTSDKFVGDYTKVTQITTRTGTAAALGVSYAVSSFEKYLDFLEAWEGYLSSGETKKFLSTANTSDKAYARMTRQIKLVERNGSLSKRIKPLVDDMADAASENRQISALIDDLREQYPKSFLPLHIVDKK